jgi:hypothetical protein
MAFDTEHLALTMTMDEVRHHLGDVSRQTIYNWVKAGRLHKVPVPGVFLVSTSSVLALVGDNAAVSPTVTPHVNPSPQASIWADPFDTN